MKEKSKRTQTDGIAPIERNLGLRRTKRSRSCVERLDSGFGMDAPATYDPRSKKRKKVTLTMTPDPDEDAVSAKRIKIEAVDQVLGTKIDNLGPKERSIRRLSLDSSRPSSRNSSSSCKSKKRYANSARKSVELTICLSPELETFFQAGKFKTVARRQSTPSLSESVVETGKRSEVKLETSLEKVSSVVVVEPMVEQMVEKKPFSNLDVVDPVATSISLQNVSFKDRAMKRLPRKKAIYPNPKTPSPKPKTSYQRMKARPSDGDYRQPDFRHRHSFDGVYVPNGQGTESFSQLDRRQSHDPNPNPNLESSLFSWSSSSLSPIQDAADSAFSNLPSTNSLANSPSPLPPSGFPDAPSPLRPNLATAVDSLPPSSFQSGATRVMNDNEDPRFLTSFPAISASPSSVAPPPFNAAYVSPTIASTTAIASNALHNSFTPLEPSSMTSSFCATPSPSIIASNPSESSISNHPSGSPSSTASPSSLDNSHASSVLALGSHMDYPDSSGLKINSGVNNLNNNNNTENNNNIRDSRHESKQECEKSTPVTPSKDLISSPIPSERDDSKTSLELFNVRLTDDVIVLKCSVCDNYTVECRSLSDISILTKVSNHIMEHVDLMN